MYFNRSELESRLTDFVADRVNYPGRISLQVWFNYDTEKWLTKFTAGDISDRFEIDQDEVDAIIKNKRLQNNAEGMFEVLIEYIPFLINGTIEDAKRLQLGPGI